MKYTVVTKRNGQNYSAMVFDTLSEADDFQESQIKWVEKSMRRTEAWEIRIETPYGELHTVTIEYERESV